MKQKRNRITSHQTDCLDCGKNWDPELLKDILDMQEKESLNMVCFCGTRHKLIENVNGWLVMRRYIKKKDQVKRIKNEE